VETALLNIHGVSFGTAQALTSTAQGQGRSNLYAAPFDALAYNGMQVNGSMDINQVFGTTVVPVPGGFTQVYVADGIQAANTGAGPGRFSVQQVASVFPGYVNELKITTTTAQLNIGTDSSVLQMPIEGYRFQRAMWGTVSAVPVTI